MWRALLGDDGGVSILTTSYDRCKYTERLIDQLLSGRHHFVVADAGWQLLMGSMIPPTSDGQSLVMIIATSNCRWSNQIFAVNLYVGSWNGATLKCFGSLFKMRALWWPQSMTHPYRAVRCHPLSPPQSAHFRSWDCGDVGLCTGEKPTSHRFIWFRIQFLSGYCAAYSHHQAEMIPSFWVMLVWNTHRRDFMGSAYQDLDICDICDRRMVCITQCCWKTEWCIPVYLEAIDWVHQKILQVSPGNESSFSRWFGGTIVCGHLMHDLSNSWLNWTVSRFGSCKALIRLV